MLVTRLTEALRSVGVRMSQLHRSKAPSPRTSPEGFRNCDYIYDLRFESGKHKQAFSVEHSYSCPLLVNFETCHAAEASFRVNYVTVSFIVVSSIAIDFCY